MGVEFFLLQNHRISFVRPAASSAGAFLNLKHENVFPCNKSEVSWQFCGDLRTLLKNPQFASRKVQMTVSFYDHISVKVDGPIINYLVRTMGPGINVRVWMGKLKNGATEVNKGVATGEITPQFTGSGTMASFHVEDCFSSVPPQVCTFLRQSCSMVSFSAEMSIRVAGNWTPSQILEIGPVAPSASLSTDTALDFNKRILSEQFQTDTVITAANGIKIGCHKIFLTGNSAVFDRMLESSTFVEGQTNSILLEDMSEVGVKTLLGYLYYGDVEPAQADFDICLEMLEASEKYAINTLQQKMKRILTKQKPEWFNVEGSLRLFCFARSLQKCLNIKKLAVRVLKPKHRELQECESFKQLFKSNAEAAMDLCGSFAALQTK